MDPSATQPMGISWFAIAMNFGVSTVMLLCIALASWRTAVFLAPKITTLVDAVLAYLRSQEEQIKSQTSILASQQRLLEAQNGKLDQLIEMTEKQFELISNRPCAQVDWASRKPPGQ